MRAVIPTDLDLAIGLCVGALLGASMWWPILLACGAL